ncbi:MAG: anhydro-N-acetylmuramic acid kinase [Pseudomonadota bacterium]
MRWQIEKLANIAVKTEKTILGLMSGTSLDGLDIALCRIKNSGLDTLVDVTAFATMPYDDITKQRIRDVFAKPSVDFKALCSLNVSLANVHVDLVREFMSRHSVAIEQIDLIASHGQTVFHDPIRTANAADNAGNTIENRQINSTFQIVDGDHIAHHIGVITVSDFRQKHVAAGGEGAPLATYGDFLLFNHASEARVLLNLGGIGNISYMPPNGTFSDVISTDTGPANTLMDAFVKTHFGGMPYDKNGDIASTGKVVTPLLHALSSHAFFNIGFPKTTGPEEFSSKWLEQTIASLEPDTLRPNDVLATLSELTALSVSNAIRAFAMSTKATVYASGGGVHNAELMTRLRKHLGTIEIKPIDALGIKTDAKEAVVFALLANECISGEPSTFGACKKSQPNVAMGKISLPF